MGLSLGAKALCVLFVTASLLALSEAKTIVVGGSKGWRYGFDYSDWAIKNSPFYFNDKLVFKYNAASAYSVYLLPNLQSYLRCDFRKAKLLANPKQGGGRYGFTVALNQWQPYYFASNGGGGRHCKSGKMKFVAVPLPHYN